FAEASGNSKHGEHGKERRADNDPRARRVDLVDFAGATGSYSLALSRHGEVLSVKARLTLGLISYPVGRVRGTLPHGGIIL
ncbi:MAG: hypothetical protein ACI9TF_001138, partial [Paracrocinitomix sp.]